MRWGVAPFITGEGGHLLARVNLSSGRLEREAQHNPRSLVTSVSGVWSAH